MKQLYSTGEVAKLCNITIRTVQFYDKGNIVKPSQLSEGGRRQYSIEDIDKIKCVQLYKSLGFSLDDIKEIMKHYEVGQLLDYMEQQELSLKQEIHLLKEKEEQLKLLKKEIESQQTITVRNIDELKKVKKHRKTERTTLILLICYEIFLFLMFPLFAPKGTLYLIVIFALTIIFLIYLIYYHSSMNAYICPKCHYKFEISFLKDAFSLNNGKKGKALTCPHCRTYTTMKEVYKDENTLD